VKSADCTVVELRRYRLQPGARDTLIELFDREFVESQEAVGMYLLGQFRDLDDPDRFVWLRGFQDMSARKRALEAFYRGPVWKAHSSAANATMISSDNVLLLRPVAGFELDSADRPPLESTAAPAGLLVATIYPLTESASVEFPEYFGRELEPVLREAGASAPATYATEHSPNTFPALPVREDVEVFVSFNVYADEARHARHVDELDRSPAWRQKLSQQLAQRLLGSPEVLRLRPTARSLLRG
jgi:quinol monooxygenase YgiN